MLPTTASFEAAQPGQRPVTILQARPAFQPVRCYGAFTGSAAFAGLIPPYEATLTAHLREAGAIIIAKTGMTELANWVAGRPTPMPGNYNAIGGFGMNPYDPRRDPRGATFDGRPAMGTGGSSSGIGTTANLWASMSESIRDVASGAKGST